MSRVIDLSSVAFSYGVSSPPVFSGVSFNVKKAARVVLVGANGAGKSTLLRLIAGRRRPSHGKATVIGEDAFEYTANALKVNLVTADWDDDLTLPVEQLVRNAVAASGATVKRVARLLEVLGVAELLHAELHALSDGQKRRVQLFCKLLPERELVLLDEATNSLDVLSRASLLAFLREESEARECTVVFCTHIFDGLDGWATELVHIDGGKMKRHVDAASLPAGETVYQTVSQWLIEHAREAREALLAAKGAPSLEAIAEALMRGGGGGTRMFAASSAKRTRPAEAAASKGPSGNDALPEGWGQRPVAIQEGAFGSHTWGAPQAEMAEEGLPILQGGAAEARPSSPEPAKSVFSPERPAAVRDSTVVSLPDTAPRPMADVTPSRAADAMPITHELTPEAQRLAPVLQGALSMLATRVSACNDAVGKGDVKGASTEAATIKSIWAQVEAAMSKLQEAQGGEVRLSPPVAMSSSSTKVDSSPFGGGNRHASEAELVRAGLIAPPTPFSS